MAISVASVFECRASVGNDNNGGFFVVGAAGTDRSKQNAAQVVIDGVTITTSITTNVITFTAGYTPTSADVGNGVQMLTGTNVTTGPPYQIISQTPTTWTLDRNVVTSGTTTNATGNMGGALATLNKLALQMAASNKAWCVGAFTSNATITFAQTGVFPGGTIAYTRIQGYGTVRGDSGRATLTLQTNTGLTGIAFTNSGGIVEQIDVDCGSLGTSTGISFNLNSIARNCKITNFSLKGITSSGATCEVYACELTGGISPSVAAIDHTLATPAGSHITQCYIHDNACTGIRLGVAALVHRNIIVNNTGSTSDGIAITLNHYATKILNNTIHANGRHGINNLSAQYMPELWKNNILTNNGGFGIVGATVNVPASPEFDGNAYGGGASANTGGTRSNMDSIAGIYANEPYTNVLDVTLSGSPYVGPTSGGSENFALNNTAGAGAACRGTATPEAWPGLPTTEGYLDFGAVQHQDPATSGPVGHGRLTGGLQ